MVSQSGMRRGGKIKVAIFVDELQATGVVVNAIAIAREVAASGMDCELIAASAGGALLPDMPAHVPVTGLLPQGAAMSRRTRLRRCIPAFRRHLRARAPDILFSAGNQGHLASVLASRGLPGCRLVVRVSNDLEHGVGDRPVRPWSRWWRVAKFRFIARRAERLVFVSRHLLKSRTLSGPDVAAKAVVIPNGVDVDRIRQRATEDCAHSWLNGPSDTPVVLAIGRLVQQKNFSTLVRAVSIARASMPLRLLIIGSGPLRQALLDDARALGLENELDIIPPVPNPMPYMARASVLALPSWWEGSSNVLLEAIACETPVVASRTAGSAEEVLGEGRFGLLVEPGDAEAMAEALRRQSGPAPVRPENRATAFSRADALAAYVALFRSLGDGERAVKPAIRP